MKRATVIMIIGLSMQVINWVLPAILSQLSGFNSESLHSIKGILGYGSIVGWLVFFAGLWVRQLDKKKSALDDLKGKTKRE